jgi:2-hydroxychromene-2-carboxylate isomerase
MDLAVRLGLNCSEFEQCMKAHTTAARLASDVQETMARRFNGTPTFLVGEAVFLGRIPDAELARLLGE